MGPLAQSRWPVESDPQLSCTQLRLMFIKAWKLPRALLPFPGGMAAEDMGTGLVPQQTAQRPLLGKSKQSNHKCPFLYGHEAQVRGYPQGFPLTSSIPPPLKRQLRGSQELGWSTTATCCSCCAWRGSILGPVEAERLQVLRLSWSHKALRASSCRSIPAGTSGSPPQ